MAIWNRKPKAADPSSITISSTPSSPTKEIVDPEAAIHAETAPQDAPSQKWKVSRAGDGDVAMALFNSPAELHEPISPEEDARVKRKVDWMILPYLGVCYAFFYIDKTTLSYAAIFGIREDLNLQGAQYSWLSSIFYFGFLAWAFPTNFLMQRLPIGRYLGFNIFLWGAFLMLQAAAHNFAGLAALRAFAGAAEACSDPSFMLITSMWYKVCLILPQVFERSFLSREQESILTKDANSAPNNPAPWERGISPTASASRWAACWASASATSRARCRAGSSSS